MLAMGIAIAAGIILYAAPAHACHTFVGPCGTGCGAYRSCGPGSGDDGATTSGGGSLPATPTCDPTDPSTPTSEEPSTPSEPPPPSGPVIYVSPDGSSTGDTRSNPKNAQAALDAARDGDTLVFLDGDYGYLRLAARDQGPGTIRLIAENPVLQSIDTQTGTVNGLTSGGAVLGYLFVWYQDGLEIDGFKFTGAEQGVGLAASSNVKITRSHFHELGLAGIAMERQSGAMIFKQNYFTNERTAGSGAYMDYGLYVSAPSQITFTGNLVDGRFNQAVSLKRYVDSALIADNYLRCKSGSCVVLGQEADRYNSSGWDDATVGSVTVRNNIITDAPNNTISIWNVREALVENNTVRNVQIAFTIRYPTAPNSGYTMGFAGPRHPNLATIRNNLLDGVKYVFVNGRGVEGDQIRFEDNRLSGSTFRWCDVGGMTDTDAGRLANEATTAEPNVTYSNNGFTCR